MTLRTTQAINIVAGNNNDLLKSLRTEGAAELHVKEGICLRFTGNIPGKISIEILLLTWNMG